MFCGGARLATVDFGLAGFRQALFQGQSCHLLVYSSAAQGTLVAAAMFCPGMALLSLLVGALVDKPRCSVRDLCKWQILSTACA